MIKDWLDVVDAVVALPDYSIYSDTAARSALGPVWAREGRGGGAEGVGLTAVEQENVVLVDD